VVSTYVVGGIVVVVESVVTVVGGANVVCASA